MDSSLHFKLGGLIFGGAYFQDFMVYVVGIYAFRIPQVILSTL